jgi:EAL and modified HD-GYP domain-containing signal transduction protein
MIRGRFAELLGQGLLSKSDAENLFFVGMFSLLDQLIGIPMPKVLSQIVLPDAVSKALLSREGIYGPFLTIAQSCEQQQGQSAKAADALFLSASAVNQAHLSALVWAQSHKP